MSFVIVRLKISDTYDIFFVFSYDSQHDNQRSHQPVNQNKPQRQSHRSVPDPKNKCKYTAT